ncbi:hypothetical protein EKO27_g1176 [Xylaria grammica]|uniref:Gylcosyl hydrolase 115 C-terminal domain-containing protein n=1 Tax=Xylaria grammica TaxID=363999 RepID=A0A439DHP3_9PEZI|nr:hypothetical protein EKO27_g1176 [Xylaria grammica]
MPSFLWLVLAAWASLVAALGQQPVRRQLGRYPCCRRLARDFGRVTGTNFTLSNGNGGAKPAIYEYQPAAANYTHYDTNGTRYFTGPEYTDPSAKDTVIIAGTLGRSKIVDDLVKAGKLDVAKIKEKWESFVTQVVEEPIDGCPKAVVIAGSDPRGVIFGLYDISEQIGVSPWYWWADVPIKENREIFVLPEGKIQGPPSVKYRGIFLNDEQPGLSGWVQGNYNNTPYGIGYNSQFYSNVFELLLRLRSNYLWPALWGSMFEVDDPANQPLADAWEIVLGSSHTEPMMRAQNEFGTFYANKGLGPWAYDQNNKTIDEYFVYGAQRAKPYANNSLWTMGMRGSGDEAIAGLGVDAIVNLLEAVVHSQRNAIEDVLGVNVVDVPQTWCLYKEVMSYIQEGLTIPEDITLLWADDNWGNVRRVPIDNEKTRSGGAGVYYHFDYVGDTRNYKWINTIQLEKTAEQMQLAYAHGADKIWIVNVGDLKPLEIPISHFLDMAYDIKQWGVNAVDSWTTAWATREFGSEQATQITDVLTRYGTYAARRSLSLWSRGQIIHQVHIGAGKNMVYANQHRNSANDIITDVLARFQADGELTARWDNLLDGKWRRMLDQTHFGYDGYWQQPMRNVLPAMAYVQSAVSSIAGNVGIAVEGLNASIPGDDKYHGNSGNTLVLPPLDPTTTANIKFTAGCGKEGFTTWFGSPVVQIPINLRKIAPSFTQGFVESDRNVAIEAPNYQRIQNPSNAAASNITYLTLKNYGRTMGGVTLWPQTTPPQTPETAPALEYDVYLFTNVSKVNVTLYLSPTQNYLSDKTPLEFAVSLFPASGAQAQPQVIRFVPNSIGPNLPAGWARAVGDSIWGLASGHSTTTRWDVAKEGAYTLRVWGLAPSVIVQKIVMDLGGVRPSYLGPPESFLVGRDEYGANDRTSFAPIP